MSRVGEIRRIFGRFYAACAYLRMSGNQRSEPSGHVRCWVSMRIVLLSIPFHAWTLLAGGPQSFGPKVRP